MNQKPKTDVVLPNNVMVNELALELDGAKEPQEYQKDPIITIMRVWLETPALLIQVTKVGQIEIIIVMVPELALALDGVQELQDENLCHDDQKT